MREMKESGSSWVGVIPSNWEMLRGKYVFEQKSDRGNTKSLVLLSPTQNYGVIPQDLYEELSGFSAVKLNEKTNLNDLKAVHKGAFVISLRSFQGGFEYSEYEGVVSPAYQVFYPSVKVNEGYYKYLFKDKSFIEKMNSYTMSLRDGKNIAFADFGRTYIPQPPIDEQKHISNYLDKKCANIDSITDDIEEQIKTLNEEKNEIIENLKSAPFSFDEQIMGLFSDGTLTKDEFELYTELKSEYSIVINTRITFYNAPTVQKLMQELDGQAKAMVVTASREAAVKYRQAFENYVQRKGYNNIHALVAFSGKVTIDGVEYTETGMNGIAEKNLPTEFDKDEYQVLLVADKYQTGFDQKKLCAMYILKKLHGVATVQTLSRLNRICPPYEKKTFVLDFANDYDSIIRDFSKFYTTTLLSNSITAASIYDIEAKLDGFYVLDPSDVEKFNSILYQGNITAKDKKTMEFLLQKAKRTIEQGRNSEEKDEIILTIRHFVRFYEFLIQVSCFEDVELHKKYNFASYLHSYLKMNSHGGGFNLNGKIKATGFAQKKEGEHKKAKVNPNPIVRLPVAEQIVLTPQKTERLSQIIAEINSRTGKSYDEDFTVKAMLQLRDIMMKSEDLKASAKNNTEKDFEFAYFDSVDDALIEGLSQNQDFFTLLLQNEEMKKEVLGIFAEEVYNKLREN